MNYSDNLIKVLLEINDEVSTFLMTLNGTDQQDIDLVDLSEKEGYITFNKIGRETRTEIKSGRFVSMLTDQFTARVIELFFNQFKSIGEYNKIKSNFVIGSGEDFGFAYNTENYSERTGSLSGSCMNNVGLGRLKLYADNPLKIKILMLKDDDGKLLGRAILWRNAFLREGETAEERNNGASKKAWILDRVYSTKDYYADIFKKYATEMGWYYKCGNNMEFMRPDGIPVKCRVKINLKEFEFGNYPYLDTMRSVSKEGTISNKRWKGEVRFY